MYPSQSGALMRLRLQAGSQPAQGHLRAPPLLFGRRPPQSNCPPGTVPGPFQGSGSDGRVPRVVSERRLHGIQGSRFKVSHLSCARRTAAQCRAAVKLHGVSPSSRGHPASSQGLRFRRVCCRDSAQIIIPFMRVRTCLTRNFATLGPL